MNFAIADGHPAIAQLIEFADEVIGEERPMSIGTSRELAETLMGFVGGTPVADSFDVLAVDTADRDVRLLLRRRDDGLLAAIFYIEGEDLGDDISGFEFIDGENRQRFQGHFDRWCQFTLEGENEDAYRSMMADMIEVEEKREDTLVREVILAEPMVLDLERLAAGLQSEALRDAISKAVLEIRAAMK